MHLMLLTFVLAVFSPASILSSQISAANPCDDSVKVYKICSSQKTLLEQSKERAGEKLLLITFGAEWCPWCLSLHHMFKNELTKKIQKNYEAQSIALYQGKEKIPEGEEILQQLMQEAGLQERPKGIPLLVLWDAKQKRALFLDTEPLEKNTKTKKGHDPKKLWRALEKARKELRSVKSNSAYGKLGKNA